MNMRLLSGLACLLLLTLAGCAPAFLEGGQKRVHVVTTTIQQQQDSRPVVAQPRVSASQARVLLGDVYRPTDGWCFNQNHPVCLSHIQWSKYDATEAQADADFKYCPPNAQQSPCGYGKAKIRANQVARQCGALHYNNLQLTVGTYILSFDYGPSGSHCGFSTGDDLTPLLQTTDSQASAAGQIQECGQSAQQGYVYLQNTRGLDCDQALADLAASESVMAGVRPFTSPAGFSCWAVSTNAQHLEQYTTMRCTKGNQAYRFTVKVYQ